MKETWLYLQFFCGNGPPCPSFGSTSLWNGVLAYGAIEEKGEWLERKRVSRHSHRQHNDRERKSVLRVTPTPLFLVFSRDLGVLSPWSRL